MCRVGRLFISVAVAAKADMKRPSCATDAEGGGKVYIRQHGSAVCVGMAMVVCMLYYKRKVALLLNRSKSRQKELPTGKECCTVYIANLTSKRQAPGCC